MTETECTGPGTAGDLAHGLDDRGDPVEGPPPAGISDCPCERRAGPLRADHHAWLLSVEDRGLPGIVGLMEHLHADPELVRAEGTLRYFDFSEFVAMHNWRDPVRMYEFASMVDGWLRLRSAERKRDDARLDAELAALPR